MRDIYNPWSIIIEFKIINPRRENSLEETLQAALAQIREKPYAAQLTARVIDELCIRSFGHNQPNYPL